MDKDQAELLQELEICQQKIANLELQLELAHGKDAVHYRALFDQSNDAVFILDLTGAVLDCNRKAVAMLGYSYEELLRLRFYDTTVVTEYKSSEAVLQSLLAGQRVLPYQRTVRKKDGSEFPVEINAEMVTDAEGKQLYIQSVVRDITERRLVEETLKNRYDLLQRIIDNNPNVVIVKDQHSRFVIANHAAAREFGKSIEELLGKTDLELHPVRHEAEAFMQDDAEALNSLQTKFVPEEPVTYADGQLHWHQTIKIPFVTSDGQRYVMAVGTDITAFKEAEKQRIELAVQKEQVQLLEALIADLSHDVKTPLASINSSLYLLTKQVEPEKQKTYIQKLQNQVEILTKLFDDILTSYRLDKGAKPIFAPLQVTAVLENFKTRYQQLFTSKNILATFALDENLPPILGNDSELSRAFANLIENAINYTPQGGSILVQSYAEASHIIVEIQDTGIGIHEKDLPHIFERFYRANRERNPNQSGTGLGLAIVKKVIELHQGEIGVKSSPEKGTSFKITLPILR